MKTISAKADDVKRNWFVVDANGKALGRLAAAVGLIDGTLANCEDPNAPFGISVGGGAAAGETSRDRLSDIITQVTTRNPNAGDFYFHLGHALDKIRKFPAAQRAFQKAVDVMPQRVGPRAQLGLMQMRLGFWITMKSTYCW